MRIQFMILSLIFAFVVISNSCVSQWKETNGPYVGGPVEAFAISGLTMLAGGDGAYFSTDSGLSWNATGLSTGVNTFLARGENILAGTWNQGIYLSTDGGRSWTASNSGLTNLDVRALVSLDSMVFAGTFGGGVFESYDSGKTWAIADSSLIGFGIFGMATSENNIYASSGNEIFRSTDLGASWDICYTGPLSTSVRTLAVSGANLLAACGQGIIRSTDQGQSWFEPDSALATTLFYSIAANGGTLIAGSVTNGVFYSSDGGDHWSKHSTGISDPEVRSVYIAGSIMLAGTGASGIYRSTNNGVQWLPVNSGLHAITFRSLSLDGSNIFAGTDYDGVLLTSDLGSSWNNVSSGLSGSHVYSLGRIGPDLFATTENAFFISTNEGANWYTRTTGMPLGLVVYSLLVKGPNIYAGTGGRGVYLSSDEGLSWNMIDTGLGFKTVFSLSGTDSEIIAGTGTGIFISKNGGANWNEIDSGLPSKICRFVQHYGTFILAGTSVGTFISSDTGLTWTHVGSGLLIKAASAFAAYRNTLFVGASNGGVFTSNDGAITWDSVGTELGNLQVTELLIDGYTLFAATARGLWKRPLVEMVPPDTFSYDLKEGWNMISLPYVVRDYTPGNLFPNAISKAFGFSNSYTIENALDNTNGFWIKMDTASMLSISGLPVMSDSISVGARWNLIGSVSNAVPVNAITSVPAGIVTSQFFTFNGSSYIIVDTLKPGLGYWVKANQVGNLYFSSSNAHLAKSGLSGRIKIVPTTELPPSPPVDIPSTVVEGPREYSLFQSFPNPFNPSSTIKYDLPTRSRVSLKIYNLLGQVVATLTFGVEEAGYKSIQWNASSFASGVYFYRLEATSVADPSKTFRQVRKMVLLK